MKRYYTFRCTRCTVSLRMKAHRDQVYLRPAEARCGVKQAVMKRVRMPK